MSLERRRVIYAGRVQGVGFRLTSEELARSFSVSGYVRNLDDGRVELVAEGETTEIDTFLEAIGAAFDGKIRSSNSENLPIGEEPDLRGFTIRV